jgi:D-beta-D-heptose 7-phosphate kinase/D-beta-D-heptose 1-phosphate adenosyltransferase
MSFDRLSLLERDLQPRILLLGDVMLDRYLFGDVERISPEAPIPVLRISKREHRLGGAGSVAAMATALGARVVLAAVVGRDAEGDLVLSLLEEAGIDTRFVLAAADRCTTVKERLLGRAQQRYPHQMMRVDQESDRPIEAGCAETLLAGFAQCIGEVDLVLVSDYDKGVCKGEMIARVAAMARAAGVPVLADPVKNADYHRYAGCTCITPNRVEAAGAAAMAIRQPQDGLDAARRLLDFGVDAAIVTLDRDGMAWADRSGAARLVAARPRQVCDVTGAGDMVLATLGYALAAGADVPTAMELANTAAGLEVERLGVVPVTRGEILAELGRNHHAGTNKIVPIDRIEAHLRRVRQAGQRIVMTNGCFDLLHPGHVASLHAARQYGDYLLVGLNSDRSVGDLKGPGRPIVNEEGRAAMLAALECVDCVVVFDEASVAGLVERVLPDVLVKGGQYDVEQIVGHEIVLRHGGRVVPLVMEADYSTSALIERVLSLRHRERSAA